MITESVWTNVEAKTHMTPDQVRLFREGIAFRNANQQRWSEEDALTVALSIGLEEFTRKAFPGGKINWNQS